jgi:RNA polymerase-binding transcription factor DksA
MPSESDTLRVLLVTRMGECSAQIAQYASVRAALTDDPSQDPTGRERAMAALHMFIAREAIEEIEAALVRIRDRRYGRCQSCDQPISLERLETIPEARTCAGCPPARAAGRPGVSRPHTSRGEHTGTPSDRVLTAISLEFASTVEEVT